jgi:hypothetical protein
MQLANKLHCCSSSLAGEVPYGKKGVNSLLLFCDASL